MPIDARRIDAASADALALVQAMLDELETHYGPWDPHADTPSATPEDLGPPGGCFVALYEDGRAVAGGGVKRLDADTGEIKRMFVVAEHRGRGLSRRLLGELEAAARELGYVRVRLDTGVKQPQARALYESSGYRSIPDYNDNPYAAYWAEKPL